MDYSLIQKNIAKHISLDANEVAYFNALLHYKELRRRDVLLQEGQPCRYLNFVHAGALRAFYVDKEGVENSIMFAINDWWVTDMYAYINRKPAMMCIDAIEDSCLLQLSHENMEKLYVAVPKFETFFRILMQNSYIREQLRVIQRLSLSAEERYLNFIEKYPQFVERISQKQIASYLGITPEFLSAIRKKLRGG
jgi:CRP-like cAMP-binding protein